MKPTVEEDFLLYMQFPLRLLTAVEIAACTCTVTVRSVDLLVVHVDLHVPAERPRSEIRRQEQNMSACRRHRVFVACCSLVADYGGNKIYILVGI